MTQDKVISPSVFQKYGPMQSNFLKEVI